MYSLNSGVMPAQTLTNTDMKKYRVELTQEEVNVLTELLNVAVMTNGLKGGTDLNARYFLNKISAGEVKDEAAGYKDLEKK
jgi:hypothetical protein